jgi:hypothetical protein
VARNPGTKKAFFKLQAIKAILQPSIKIVAFHVFCKKINRALFLSSVLKEINHSQIHESVLEEVIYLLPYAV